MQKRIGTNEAWRWAVNKHLSGLCEFVQVNGKTKYKYLKDCFGYPSSWREGVFLTSAVTIRSFSSTNKNYIFQLIGDIRDTTRTLR